MGLSFDSPDYGSDEYGDDSSGPDTNPAVEDWMRTPLNWVRDVESYRRAGRAGVIRTLGILTAMTGRRGPRGLGSRRFVRPSLVAIRH